MQERLAYTSLDDQAKKAEDPFAEKAKAIDDRAKKPEDPSAEKAKAIEGLFPPTEKVGKIGDLNPVQDFESMLAERSSSAWVLKAIEEMKNYMANLIQDSPKGDYYQKALECFVALRKACIIEQVILPIVIYSLRSEI
jgi:ATP-dependent DNA helicase 2 subunit 2